MKVVEFKVPCSPGGNETVCFPIEECEEVISTYWTTGDKKPNVAVCYYHKIKPYECIAVADCLDGCGYSDKVIEVEI